LVGIPSRYLQKEDFGYRAGFLAGDRKAKKLFAPGVNFILSLIPRLSPSNRRKMGHRALLQAEDGPSRFIAGGRWAIALYCRRKMGHLSGEEAPSFV
jgi:hypothetical protein